MWLAPRQTASILKSSLLAAEEPQENLTKRIMTVAMKYVTFVVLLALSGAGSSSAETQTEPTNAAGEICIRSESPQQCLESYGFVCNKSMTLERSIDGFRLGCNGGLPDGQMHFIQILYADGGWSIENQQTYVPETYVAGQPDTSREAALETYVQGEMTGYRMQSEGIRFDYMNELAYVKTGSQRIGELLVMRSVCAVVVDDDPNDAIWFGLEQQCNDVLLRGILMLSQSGRDVPYRAAGRNEIHWQKTTITLNVDDIAYVVDGSYEFPANHVPCKWLSNCCSSKGYLFLDSCREPTESESEAVDYCLAEGFKRRSPDYVKCLREQGVAVGCEDQLDGSRLCQ